ncbi:MAG: hypothetical protein JXQ75_07470 [Phycisphaerae bacterium]|nr:hypothetical protein [Phycisphaerae bacterium]
MMTPRERILVILVGTAIVLGLGYKGVGVLLVKPLDEAKKGIVSLEGEKTELEGVIRSRMSLARRWLNYTGRTFSFEEAEAKRGFGKELKELAKRHGFDHAVFGLSSGTAIGRGTNIRTVGHRITIEGGFSQVIAFLRDLYETPYLCQITKLGLSPLGAKGGRGDVKLEFTIESPLLPKLDSQKIREVANAAPMPAEPKQPLGPARKYVGGDDRYDLLARRNIFRSYLPPPLNLVLIDNQDRKTVGLKIRFFWEDEVNQQLKESVAGTSSLPVKGNGDLVEIEGIYADGTTFGPKRLAFDGKKDQHYVVRSHTPAPPPTVIDLAVDNQHSEAVYLEVVVTTGEGGQRNEPLMMFEPGVSDVREYEDVKSLTVAAMYASDKRTRSQTFTPGEGKQTFVVGPEPAEEVAVDDQGEGDAEPIDPPADPAFTVTGLVYYPDPLEGERMAQEMIVSRQGERTIIRVGAEGDVDGGTLLAVVPALGGLVRMPETGNYYIYPLGRQFTGRVKLDAKVDDDLPAAIDAWTRR